MSRSRRTKRQPTSLRHAMELCLRHARSHGNRSVDRVADLMGLTSKWTLYKWLENSRLPANLIRPFEHACGADYVSAYIALSSGKFLIEVPTGQKVGDGAIHSLQASCTDAVGALLQFHQGELDAESTNAALMRAMQELAWHRGAVERTAEPEFDFSQEQED